MFRKKEVEKPTPMVIESVCISRRDKPDQWLHNVKTWKRNTHDYQFNFYDGQIFILPSFEVTGIMLGRVVMAPIDGKKE